MNICLSLRIHTSLFHTVIMSAYVSTGLLPNPVWPPSGVSMPGAPMQPSVPVAKPVVTQPVPVSSESECFYISVSLSYSVACWHRYLDYSGDQFWGFHPTGLTHCTHVADSVYQWRSKFDALVWRNTGRVQIKTKQWPDPDAMSLEGCNQQRVETSHYDLLLSYTQQLSMTGLKELMVDIHLHGWAVYVSSLLMW